MVRGDQQFSPPGCLVPNCEAVGAEMKGQKSGGKEEYTKYNLAGLVDSHQQHFLDKEPLRV